MGSIFGRESVKDSSKWGSHHETNDESTHLDPFKSLLGAIVLSFELSRPKVVSNSTNSTANFDLAQKWLRNCLDNHERCNHNTEMHWKPTRLIELDQPFSGSVALNCWSDEMIMTTA